MADRPVITLEPLRPDHAAEMFAGLADPTGYRFLPDEPPDTVAALRARYERQVVGRSADGAETWANWIVRHHGSGIAVGYTQATIRDGSALLGYHLFPCCWRRGLGTQAVASTIDTLFATKGLRDVRALVDTRNTASSSLMRKLGFSLRRTIIDADTFKGCRSDEHEFVMARAAWSRRHPRPRPAACSGPPQDRQALSAAPRAGPEAG